MNTTYVSATELKRNAAEILNGVYYKKNITVIKKFGKAIAKIVPLDEKETPLQNVKEILDSYFGSMPDFPSAEEIRKARYFRKRKIKL